jgi:hypothetical protein
MELYINDRLRNRKVEFFNSYNFSLRYNSVSSPFSFDFYFDPKVFETKEMACVSHYHLCTLYHKGELFLTGQFVSQGFESSEHKNLVSISGYSLPGILEDSCVPTNKAIDQALLKGTLKLSKGSPAKPYAYPLEDSGLSLKQIAEKYLAVFNISILIDDSVKTEMDTVIETTTLKPTDKIKAYLCELAAQRDINISHDKFGNLVFAKARTNLIPILSFNVPEGGLPGVRMKMIFNGQEMHSQITVMKQSSIADINEGEETVTNPYVPYVFRPITIMQNSGDNSDTITAAKRALANELRGLKLDIYLDRWDKNGKLLLPNNILSVINPEIYIFKKTDFFIESIDYSGDEKENTAVLHCVLPEVYNGQYPKYIFAGINNH